MVSARFEYFGLTGLAVPPASAVVGTEQNRSKPPDSGLNTSALSPFPKNSADQYHSQYHQKRIPVQLRLC
jgi:hypothetical protein